MGDSAGGGLSLALAEYFRMEGIRLPDELVLISPWVDTVMENEEIKAYEPKAPFLCVSSLRVYRGKGIGTDLMRRMLERLKEQGYKKASLAVQKTNYAVRMYEKAGFRTVDENDEEYIMVCEL